LKAESLDRQALAAGHCIHLGKANPKEREQDKQIAEMSSSTSFFNGQSSDSNSSPNPAKALFQRAQKSPY
jgi:hypothetical protein